MRNRPFNRAVFLLIRQFIYLTASVGFFYAEKEFFMKLTQNKALYYVRSLSSFCYQRCHPCPKSSYPTQYAEYVVYI